MGQREDFRGLSADRAGRKGAAPVAVRNVCQLLCLCFSLLFQTSHLNFPAARLPSSPLTNNVCVYVPGLRRGLILGLEISLEVPICSDRETTMNRRACENQKRASGCLSGWWLAEAAAIAGVVVKGEGDGKGKGKRKKKSNRK